jgi:hypothetical protein
MAPELPDPPRRVGGGPANVVLPPIPPPDLDVELDPEPLPGSTMVSDEDYFPDPMDIDATTSADGHGAGAAPGRAGGVRRPRDGGAPPVRADGRAGAILRLERGRADRPRRQPRRQDDRPSASRSLAPRPARTRTTSTRGRTAGSSSSAATRPNAPRSSTRSCSSLARSRSSGTPRRASGGCTGPTTRPTRTARRRPAGAPAHPAPLLRLQEDQLGEQEGGVAQDDPAQERLGDVLLLQRSASRPRAGTWTWWRSTRKSNIRLWYPEMSARLLDRRKKNRKTGKTRSGKFIWSATPQAGTVQLYQLCHRAEEEEGEPRSRSRSSASGCWTTRSSPALQGRSSRSIATTSRSTGSACSASSRSWARASTASSCPAGRPRLRLVPDPHEWTRYATLDPGRQVCAILFAACPPPGHPDFGRVYLYDELYVKRANAEIVAEAVKARSSGTSTSTGGSSTRAAATSPRSAAASRPRSSTGGVRQARRLQEAGRGRRPVLGFIWSTASGRRRREGRDRGRAARPAPGRRGAGEVDRLPRQAEELHSGRRKSTATSGSRTGWSPTRSSRRTIT